MNAKRYQWAQPGDINAFFGLMLDNIAGLALLVLMLEGFDVPVKFSLRYMVPGTAIGVLIGDLIFFVVALMLARRTGRTDVTAMPLGLDTPSTIGMALLVLGPAFKNGSDAGLTTHEAAMQMWHIGMCAILITGLIKAVLSLAANWIHRVFPRAGLLGSLAAIALVLISFSQMPKVINHPVVGFASLAMVLVALVGRKAMPGKLPGALVAVAVGCGLHYLMFGVQQVSEIQLLPYSPPVETVLFPTAWMEAWKFQWLSAIGDTIPYLGYIVPFAVATVIGGVDCAESAASVGDPYRSRVVIATEAFATLVASVCGGVVQTTPYIGHPAYKAMGGRAAYVLATALFVGSAGLVGFFGYVLEWLPEAALVPILVFIGIEITAQSFHATPRRHYAAIAVACIPAMAKLLAIYIDQLTPVIDYNLAPEQAAFLQSQVRLANVLAGGFIFGSLIWASAAAMIVDRRYQVAAAYFFSAGVMVLFGVMHSPLPGDRMYWPWEIGQFNAADFRLVVQLAVAYVVIGGLMLVMAAISQDEPIIETDQAFEKLAS